MKKPYLKLRRLIEDSGLSNKELAAQAGMGESTLSKHFSAAESCGEWRWREIDAICKVVGIPQERIGELFFPEVKKGDPA